MSEVAQFNGIMEIYHSPTLVAMVTQICQFYHKISYISAYIRDITKILARNMGYSRWAQFNGIIEIYPTLTLVAMVTENCEF